jgi:hypothetical protein
MLQQIDRRRVKLEGQADGLRKQLAGIEEELVELAAAAQMVGRFLPQPLTEGQAHSRHRGATDVRLQQQFRGYRAK